MHFWTTSRYFIGGVFLFQRRLGTCSISIGCPFSRATLEPDIVCYNVWASAAHYMAKVNYILITIYIIYIHIILGISEDGQPTVAVSLRCFFPSPNRKDIPLLISNPQRQRSALVKLPAFGNMPSPCWLHRSVQAWSLWGWKNTGTHIAWRHTENLVLTCFETCTADLFLAPIAIVPLTSIKDD